MTLERIDIDSGKPVGHAYHVNGQIIIRPLQGFEHLFSTTVLPQEPSPSPSHSPPQGEIDADPGDADPKPEPDQAASTREAAPASVLRKRSSSQSDLQDPEQEPPKKRRTYERRKTDRAVYTLHIGDEESTKHFYRTRLREIGLKALRQIVTEWVKIIEPNRLRLYGPYHKKSPAKSDPARSPPWWSKDVPYEEPAHLQVKCLEVLGADLLVYNSTRDLQDSVGPAQESWTSRLENAAMYFVSSIPVQEYSMSIDLKYNAEVKERTLNEVLPEIFMVVAEHEGWVAERADGLRKTDAKGPAFTWGPLAKPPAYGKMKSRKEDPEFQRKRDQLTGRKRLKPLYKDDDDPPKVGNIRKSSVPAPETGNDIDTTTGQPMAISNILNG